MPSDPEQMALTLNGKKRNIKKGDFLKLADNMHLAPGVANRLIQQITQYENAFMAEVKASHLPQKMKKDFCALIQNRLKVLMQRGIKHE